MAGKNLDTERLAEDLQSLREMNAAQREADARLYKSLMDVSSWWKGTSAEAMEAWAARAYAAVTAVRDETELDIEQTQVYLNRVVEKDRQYANRMAAFGSGNSIGTGVGSVAQQTSRGMQSLEFKKWLSKVTGVSADTNALAEHFSKLGFGLSEVYWIYEGLKKNGVTAEHIGNLDKIGYTFDDVAKDYSRITKISDKELYCYMLKGGKGIDREEKKNPGSWKGMLTDIRADGSLSDTTKIRLVSITDGDVTNLVNRKQGVSSPGISVTSEYGSETEHESKVEMVTGGTVGGVNRSGLKNGVYVENGKKVYYIDDEIVDPQALSGHDGMKNGKYIENGRTVYYVDDEKPVDTPKTIHQEQMLNQIIEDYEKPEVVLEDPGIKMVYNALGEIGFKEEMLKDEDGNYSCDNKKVKYNELLWNNEDIGYSWCAAFLYWNAYCTGETNDINYPHNKTGMAKVIYLRDWFDNQKNEDGESKYHLTCDDNKNGYENRYIPKTGDVFIHVKTGTTDGHTGFVYAYDEKEDMIYTIEGNAKGQGDYQGLPDDAGFEVVLSKRSRSYVEGFCETGGEYRMLVPDDKMLTGVIGAKGDR